MKLIFDIETIGENFDELDETTQDALSWWIKKESSGEEDYKVALEELKNGLGFSPLTGQIVAIGVLDREKNKGAIYYQNPDNPAEEMEEDGIKFKALSEKEMLEKFWQGAEHYDEFVSFNGRSFDVPFLMIRSAVHGLRPSRNLMPPRYMSQQKYGPQHIDLADQLSFYGSIKRSSLHFATKAFSIQSPKEGGMSGEEVPKAFREGRYEEIARYCMDDVLATKKLFEYWDQYLNFEINISS